MAKQRPPRLTRPGITTLGQRIRSLREAFREKQEDLAKALDVTPASVSNWESGDSKPTAERVKEIADYYKVSAGWVQYAEGETPRVVINGSATPAEPTVEEFKRIPEFVSTTTNGTDPPAAFWVAPPLGGLRVRVWRSTVDFEPVSHGDWLFVDENDNVLQPPFLYLVEIGDFRPQLLRGIMRVDGGLELQDARGQIIDVQAVKHVIGRIVARYGTI